MALYRCVGSPKVMAEQCAHVAEVASLPNVTIHVMPAVAHPANASGFVIADDSAWCENVKGGYVYTGETVTPLPALFDTPSRGVPEGVGVNGPVRKDDRHMESTWRKSTYSDANGGQCVEVASDGRVMVRDTTNRDGVTLSVPADAWAKFTAPLR